MTPERHYPPDFCNSRTMAYLLDVSPSKFRDLVAKNKLPAGFLVDGMRRWDRLEVYGAWQRLQDGPGGDSGDVVPPDPILEAVRGPKAQAHG